MNCFIDCDGVLAAFSEHVLARCGKRPHEISDEAMWSLIAQIPDFWITIPVKCGAHSLWRAVEALRPVVLTGCPLNHFDVAAAQKVQWVQQKFGSHVEVIPCIGRNKSQYIRQFGDILVDDFGSNVKRWRNAGGRAIHHRNVEQAITEFNTMVLTVDDKVQVLINDVFALSAPASVVDIQEHAGQHWVFVTGSHSGVPIRDVVLVEKAMLA